MADIPKIRFKGFTEPWEQRKLGEICSRVQGNDGRMELPTLTISAANGWMKQEDRFSGNIAGKEQKNYTLLHKGELSYNHGNSKLAKYGTVFSLQTYEEALVPRVYHSFKVEIGSADFIEYYFATKMPDRELRKLISSGARMDGLLNIGYDDFMGIKMMFPSVLEQDKIAEYFRAFDHLITLHQRKCDDTKELKKYMLQKMFPKNGEKFPEIRFKGFTEAWEQRKVFDLLELLTDYDANGSFADMAKNVNTTDGDGYAWYVRITDLENPKPLKELKYVDESSYKFLKKTELHGGELLMAKRGDIGKVYIFEPRTKYATVAPNMYLLKLNNKVIPHFLYDYFVSNEGNKKLTRLNASSTMGALYKDDVKNIDVIMPSTEEQTMIGNFFQSIDNLITLHQRKCDTLKELKKYMLQNMFPKKG